MLRIKYLYNIFYMLKINYILYIYPFNFILLLIYYNFYFLFKNSLLIVELAHN